MAANAHGYDFVYLKNTVGGPLAEAMAQLALDQPEDPVDYLGRYLLKYVANEKQRQDRVLQSRFQRTDADIAAEETAKEIEKIAKAKQAHDEQLLAETATREQLLNTDIAEVLCSSGMAKLVAATQAESCYLGRKVSDPDGANFIQWFTATENSLCVVDKFVTEETGITFDALKEVEDPNAQPDEEGNLPPPAIPKYVHIENVIREPRMKYFGIPRMGAYLVRGLKYNSYLHDDVVQPDNMPALESWLIVAVDTVGKARAFSNDNIQEFLKWSSAFVEAYEQYEKRTVLRQIEWKRTEEKDARSALTSLKDSIQAYETRASEAVASIEDEGAKGLQEALLKCKYSGEYLATHVDTMQALGRYLIPYKVPVLRTLAAALILWGYKRQDIISSATKLPVWDKIRQLLDRTILEPKMQAFDVQGLPPKLAADAKDVLGETTAEDVELPSPILIVLHSWIQQTCGAIDALVQATQREQENAE